MMKDNKCIEYMSHVYTLVVFFSPFNLVLGDPEVTANIYCKSRNLPNTDTQNHSTDLR